MPVTIGKSDLVKSVGARVGLPNTKVEAVVDAVLDQITKELGAGRRVRLTGYFSIFTKVMAPRKVRHPQSGEMVDVPARTKVQFTTGSRMKRMLEARLPSEHFFGHADTARRAKADMQSGDIGEALDKLGGDSARTMHVTEEGGVHMDDEGNVDTIE